MACQMADDTLKLSKVGAVRIKAHRPLEGTPKTCTIRRTSTGKWYATIACEVEPQPLPERPQETGLDVGLSHCYTLSDGTPTIYRFLRRDEKDLQRTQRQLSAAPQGTAAQAKRRKIVARVHERIAHRRTNCCHQERRRLVRSVRVHCR